MNPESEQCQVSMDKDLDDMTNSVPNSKITERQLFEEHTRGCDPHESAMIKVNLRDTSANKTSESLKALLEQQEYKEMRNTSWADLMEKEITESGSDLNSKEGEGTFPKIQSMETDYVILSSGEEYPGLSNIVKQSVLENGRTSTWKKRGETKYKLERNFKFTEAPADHALKINGQVSEKPLRRAAKRDKTQRVRAMSVASTDDEEVQVSSKYQKKRRKGARIENVVCKASKSKFNSEDLSVSSTRHSSRESSPGSTSSIASTLHIRKGWSEPKLGWCKSETILLRRSKEIEKAKEKPVYAKYLAKVPRHARTKDMPKTPNKYIQYSRRSWDKQVRLWKRRLYEWAGEEPTQSCLSLNESTGDEISDSESAYLFPSTLMSDENKLSLEEIKVEQDAAASLLGYLDIDTRTNTLTVMKVDDESTLKGTSRSVLGPKDFSQL